MIFRAARGREFLKPGQDMVCTYRLHANGTYKTLIRALPRYPIGRQIMVPIAAWGCKPEPQKIPSLGLYAQTAEISVGPISACFEVGQRCANVRFCLVTTGYRRINGLPDAKTYCQIIRKGNRLLQFMLTEISAVWAYNPSLGFGV